MDLEQAQKLDAKHVFGTYGRLPVLLVKGRGVYVYDSEGKRYLDMLAGLSVNALGHCNSRVTAAVKKQVTKLSHVSNLYYTEPMIHLAERLNELSGMRKCFFGNSGAEANEAAIKLVRRYHSQVLGDGRSDIICMKNSFHGRTMLTVTATGQDVYKQGFDPLPPGFKHSPMNDLEALEKKITKKTAAVMVEPVQGEGGVYPATKKFMKGLASLRRKHGIQLIFDEVQCGLGRTGKWFAYMHYGVKPDVMTLAKPVAGGLPMGVMLAQGRVVEGFAPGSHASTFGANPVISAGALAFLEEMEEKNLVERVAENGDYFMGRLEELRKRRAQIKEIRGLGLMTGIEMDADAKEAAQFFMDNGVLVNAVRPNVLRALPPYIIEKKHIDLFVKLLDYFLERQ